MKLKHKKEIEEKFLGFSANYHLFQQIKNNEIMIFIKNSDYYCRRVKDLFICGIYLYYFSKNASDLTLGLGLGSCSYYTINHKLFPALIVKAVDKNGNIYEEYLYYNK